jgi:hypothetical protein
MVTLSEENDFTQRRDTELNSVTATRVPGISTFSIDGRQ